MKKSQLWRICLAAAVVLSSVGISCAKTVYAEDKVEVTLCETLLDDKPVHPTTKFRKDSPSVNGAWKSNSAGVNLNYRVVWIADDTGSAAPPNTKITEKSGKAYGLATSWSGHFTLTRPDKGWPPGRYHVELYLNDKLAKSVPFTVQ